MAIKSVFESVSWMRVGVSGIVLGWFLYLLSGLDAFLKDDVKGPKGVLQMEWKKLKQQANQNSACGEANVDAAGNIMTVCKSLA